MKAPRLAFDHAEILRAAVERLRGKVNTVAQLNPNAAFAGRKQSGFGLENGIEGLLDFGAARTIATAG